MPQRIIAQIKNLNYTESPADQIQMYAMFTVGLSSK